MCVCVFVYSVGTSVYMVNNSSILSVFFMFIFARQLSTKRKTI